MNNKDHDILEFLYPAEKKFPFGEIAKANLMARNTLSKHLTEKGIEALSKAKGYNNVDLLDLFEDSAYDEPTLLELEKKLIHDNVACKNIEPKPVMIADTNRFDARTTDDTILVSNSFLQKNPTLKEINDLLKRELLRNVRK